MLEYYLIELKCIMARGSYVIEYLQFMEFSLIVYATNALSVLGTIDFLRNSLAVS